MKKTTISFMLLLLSLMSLGGHAQALNLKEKYYDVLKVRAGMILVEEMKYSSDSFTDDAKVLIYENKEGTGVVVEIYDGYDCFFYINFDKNKDFVNYRTNC